MTTRKRRTAKVKQHIYTRERGGQIRFYGDFRHAGGQREPLVADGDTRATTNPDTAQEIYTARLAVLKGLKRERDAGKRVPVPLAAYVAHHLTQKALTGKYSETWLADSERMLRLAIAFFGADRDIGDIGVTDVQEWTNALRATSNRRGGMMSAGAIRHHLNVLSNLYVRAQSETKVPLAFNPVQSMMDKPSGDPEEAKWLTAHEAAAILESARTYVPTQRKDLTPLPFMYPLIATYLLTGGRETEVLGLEVQDIDFKRKLVTIRPNKWRRLKTKKSQRDVPLWPQLAEILQPYVKSLDRESGLLFQSPTSKEPAMVVDFRKPLDAIAIRTGLWQAGDVRSKAFRHTYCVNRLQSLDAGESVAIYTVSREMGHSTTKLVEDTYGHIDKSAPRAPVIEYRVEHHEEELRPVLTLLKSA